MFMGCYSMERKYCITWLEIDTSSFSQAIFVIYEHVLMKIILLTMMTGFKQLIPVRDKDSCSNRFQRFSWISDFDFIWKELTCYFAFLLNLVADKGSDKVKFPVGNKAPSEDLVWLKVWAKEIIEFSWSKVLWGTKLKNTFSSS